MVGGGGTDLRERRRRRRMAFNAWSLDGVLTPINPQPVSPRNMEHDQKIGTNRRHRHTLDVLKILLLNVGIRGKLCTLKKVFQTH